MRIVPGEPRQKHVFYPRSAIGLVLSPCFKNLATLSEAAERRLDEYANIRCAFLSIMN